MSQNLTTTSTINVIDGADTTWVLNSSALVFITIPGGALFYSGNVSHSQNRLTILLTSILTASVISIMWFVCGYSLVFSETGSFFIGNFDNAFLNNVGNKPHKLAPTIPSNAFMIFQCMFAAIVGTIPLGSVIERSSLRVYIVFVIIWSIIVYDVVACWVWGCNGWLRNLGCFDYAGGTPIHVVAGFTALAYAIAIGPRKNFPKKEFKPTNLNDVFLGLFLLWFGWFGFNAGSEGRIDSRAVNAFVVTNISASVGGVTQIATEMIFNRTKKVSLYGFSCGTVAGLVCITPAAGFVSPRSSIAFGFVGGSICYLSCKLKTLFKYKIDDSSDVFPVHGIGGMLGGILTGVFAEQSIMSLSYPQPLGGWLDGQFMQVVYQLTSCISSAFWAFTMSFIILKLMNLISFLKLKATDIEEDQGMDWSDLGEQAYGHDLESNLS